MLKTILYTMIIVSALIVMSARDKEQKEIYKQIIDLCIETGQHCPKHLRGE